MSAAAVFLPWLAVALAVSLLLCAGQVLAWLARRIRYRAEFAQAMQGRRRILPRLSSAARIIPSKSWTRWKIAACVIIPIEKRKRDKP